MYKIIIFDFDGTIADTNKCIIETFQQSLLELGFDTMEEKDISRLIGLPLTHMYAQLLRGSLALKSRFPRNFYCPKSRFPQNLCLSFL